MRVFTSILIVLCVIASHAQTDSTKTGEIISGEVVIEKNKEILLPKADKIFLRSVPKSFLNQPLNLTFDVKEPSFEWPDYKSDVPFQSIEETYPKAQYQNYIKAGYGNFSSPLLEVGFFKMFGDFDTKARLFYESFKSGPVNGDNSGSSDGGIQLSSTYKSKTIAITPLLSFRSRTYRFYGNSDRVNTGFDSTRSPKVLLNNLAFSIGLKGGNEDISYSIKPHFSFINEDESDSPLFNEESTIGVNGMFNYGIDDSFTTGFDLEGLSSSYDGGISYSRSLINVNPWVKYKKDNLLIKAGFILSSGKVADDSKTGFYPDVRVDYDLSDKWLIYGILSGGQTWNGLQELLNENEFLDDSLAISHVEYTYKFGGGIKGSPIKNLLFDASLISSSTKGLPFFVPSINDSSRYNLAYDTEPVNIISLKSSVSYMPTATSMYGASLEINGYSVKTLDRPWNRPTYIFKAHTSHNIKERIIVSAYLSSMGGIRSPANVNFGYVNLSAFVDVGLGAKYLITERASAFIDVNNLLNNEYERYLGYPTRGLAFKIGGQYRF
ncbi:TonB-dependent receptor [Ekhidna sp.]